MLESSLDKEIKPVNPKRNQPWTFIGRTDAEAPILWPPETESWLIGKDRDAGKDWRQKEKRAAEDEMVRQHHWFNRHEFEQIPGDSQWRTGKPRVLQPRRIWHDLATEQQHKEWLSAASFNLANQSIWQVTESSGLNVKWSEVKSLSRVRLFAIPWTAAYQAPPSMGFSR